MKIVFVYTGVIPDYFWLSIKQALYFGHEVYTLTDEKISIDNVKSFSTSELKSTRLDEYNSIIASYNLDNFRNGFWVRTMSRFFYISEFMKKYNFEKIVHLESDVLVYTDELKIPSENTLGIVKDAHDRCIPSIVYIPNYHELDRFLDYSLDILRVRFVNDMNLLGSWRRVALFQSHLDPNYDYIYDGAAIGQYIGGVDPRNISGDTTGFINETSDINLSGSTFEKGILKKGGMEWRIHILHVHSKKLEKFISF